MQLQHHDSSHDFENSEANPGTWMRDFAPEHAQLSATAKMHAGKGRKLFEFKWMHDFYKVEAKDRTCNADQSRGSCPLTDQLSSWQFAPLPWLICDTLTSCFGRQISQIMNHPMSITQPAVAASRENIRRPTASPFQLSIFARLWQSISSISHWQNRRSAAREGAPGLSKAKAEHVLETAR